ncbi:MAG: putative transposase [Candidatus Azotimanducaceae bacterium]|jgi:putative transposase
MGRKQGHRLGPSTAVKPQQNAYIKRYNRTVRHEWLDLQIFETIDEV